MIKQFADYIRQNHLFTQTDKILLAVSGGADSIVLTDLCIKCNFNIAIAHCNFKLRGADADNDELFVRNFAKKHNIKSHFISFNTTEYSKKHKISIEMAARELRYEWFYNLKKEFGYNYIATGHHLNDSIETVLLNLTRGTGYKGLSGIANKHNNIVRPLLFATRSDIEEYAQKHNLQFCTDVTNQSDVFIRNKIRNQIIPLLKEINPAFESVMLNNLQNITEANYILNNYFKEYKHNSILEDNTYFTIPFNKIDNVDPIKIHLFELINTFGFSTDTINKVADAIINKNKTGALFYSDSHTLLLDRDAIIIRKKTSDNNTRYNINEVSDFNSGICNIKAQTINIEDFNLIKNRSIACLDTDKLQFPLTIRRWKQGDYFYPLGMKNKQKVSDFLINNKVNRFAKDDVLILEDANNNIIWIVNYRIDNRFKVTETTKHVLQLEYNNSIIKYDVVT